MQSRLASQLGAPTAGTGRASTSTVNRSWNSSPLISNRPTSASPRTYKGLSQSSMGLGSRVRSSLAASPSSPSTPSTSLAEVRAKFLEAQSSAPRSPNIVQSMRAKFKEAQSSTPRSPKIVQPINWDDDALLEGYIHSSDYFQGVAHGCTFTLSDRRFSLQWRRTTTANWRPTGGDPY
eukprot:1203180-Pyramimonas_sp.AAC.1